MTEVMLVGLISVVAMIVGPISAVYITRHLDHQREERGRKVDVFRALMKTRRLRLSSEHVAALNLIEIEFYGHPDVTNARKVYFENLARKLPEDQKEREKHFEQQEQLLAKLLHAMGKSLKFDNIEQIDIMTGGYSPQGWADIEAQQHVLRLLLIDMLNGNRSIPISPIVKPTATSPYPPPPAEEDQVPAVIDISKKVKP